MDTIVERDTGSSAAVLVFGIIVVAVIAFVALYFFRLYPFTPSAQQPGTTVNVTGQVPSAVTPSSSGN